MKVRLKAIILIALVALIVPVLLGYTSSLIGASHSNVVKTHSDSKSYSNDQCIACHTTLTENGRDTRDDRGVAGNVPGAHRKHFLTVFLNFANNFANTPTAADQSQGCAWCHQATVYDGVGISNAWTGASGTNLGWGQGLEGDLTGTTVTATNIPPLRKQVDPNVCIDCHGQASNGGSAHTAAIAAGTLENCGALGTCHGGSGAEAIATVHTSSNPTDVTSGVWGIDQRYANSFTYCGLCHGDQAWFQVVETTNTW